MLGMSKLGFLIWLEIPVEGKEGMSGVRTVLRTGRTEVVKYGSLMKSSSFSGFWLPGHFLKSVVKAPFLHEQSSQQLLFCPVISVIGKSWVLWKIRSTLINELFVELISKIGRASTTQADLRKEFWDEQHFRMRSYQAVAAILHQTYSLLFWHLL